MRSSQSLPKVTLEDRNLLLHIRPHARRHNYLMDLLIRQSSAIILGILHDPLSVSGVSPGFVVLFWKQVIVPPLDTVLDGCANFEQVPVFLDRGEDRLEHLPPLAASQGRTPDFFSLDGDLQKRGLDTLNTVLALLCQSSLSLVTDRRLAWSHKSLTGPSIVTTLPSTELTRSRPGMASWCRIPTLVPHFHIDIVDGRLGAYKTFEVALNEDLQGGGLLLD